jgi:hypothetical protein
MAIAFSDGIGLGLGMVEDLGFWGERVRGVSFTHWCYGADLETVEFTMHKPRFTCRF